MGRRRNKPLISSRSHAGSDAPSHITYTFAENGDTTITVTSGWGASRSFIVSSTILKHSSPVFRAFLEETPSTPKDGDTSTFSRDPLADFDVASLTRTPNPEVDTESSSRTDSPETGEIIEVHTPPSSQEPEMIVVHHQLHLKNYDIHAMDVIFRALHFIHDEIPSARSISPQMLLDIAMHCETFDCIHAMQGWILHWCGGPYTIHIVQDWGYMLLSAWILKSEYFGKIMQEAARRLPPWFPPEWDEDPSLARMPQQVTDWIKRNIATTFSQIENLFQRGEGHLRSFTNTTDLPPSCRRCKRYLPFKASRCDSCNFHNFVWKECTRDSRIADYFSILREHRLWPTTKFRRYSLRRFLDAIAPLKRETACACEAGGGCAVTMYVRGLPEEVRRLLDGIEEVGEDWMRKQM